MADRPSGDRPFPGAVEGPRQPHAAPPSESADEQALADADQTLAGAEQSFADADQIRAGVDQSAADYDQLASERDQLASDRDLLHGGDAATHAATKELRERGARERRKSATVRCEAGGSRDDAALTRDLSAAGRDQIATLRNRDTAAREDAAGEERLPPGSTSQERTAAATRQQLAAGRHAGQDTRVGAAADREVAARDRAQAAYDRGRPRSDHDLLTSLRAVAETDALTGALTRTAGLAELELEIDRTRGSVTTLSIGYVDIAGLKAVNHAYGHAAGDDLLQHVADAIRAALRSYDRLIRIGDDEFVCVLRGAPIDDARLCLHTVQTQLAADAEPCYVRIGCAELTAQDTPADLIRRADDDLVGSSPQ